MQTIDKNKLPKHVAVIMDGNRRWAKKNHLPTYFGHQRGTKKLLSLLRWCLEYKIIYLTLYCLSIENLQRQQEELTHLFKYIDSILEKKNINFIKKNGIKINVYGNMELLPKKTIETLHTVQRISQYNTNLQVQLCIGYGGQQEIIMAIKNFIIHEARLTKNIQDIANRISIDELEKHLFTYNIPTPDLMIRCGGEQRLSNFLLWQLSYTELYFTNTLWPAFKKKDFLLALYNYSLRMRRYGK